MSVARLARLTLVFLLAVILWGAFVRATGSGAGCGKHWPLCNGEVIPLEPGIKTIIEFTHRVTSGLSLILCASLGWLSFKQHPKGSFTRKAAIWSVIFVFLEALLGAGLVLLELVAHDKSVMRTISLGVHLINTFFLIGAVALCARFAAREESGRGLRWRSWSSDTGVAAFSITSIFVLLILGSSGAMTALGDTLFPASSVAEGLRQDVSPTSHFLIQLRVLHPSFAVLSTLFMAAFGWVLRKRCESRAPEAAQWATFLILALIGQLALGMLNILLLAPTVMQLTHLLVADLIWLLLIQLLASLWTQEA